MDTKISKHRTPKRPNIQGRPAAPEWNGRWTKWFMVRRPSIERRQLLCTKLCVYKSFSFRRYNEKLNKRNDINQRKTLLNLLYPRRGITLG